MLKHLTDKFNVIFPTPFPISTNIQRNDSHVSNVNTLLHSLKLGDREQCSSKNSALLVRLQEFIHTPILLQGDLLLRRTEKIRFTKSNKNRSHKKPGRKKNIRNIWRVLVMCVRPANLL